MMKKMILVLTVVVLGLGFVGCGEETSVVENIEQAYEVGQDAAIRVGVRRVIEMEEELMNMEVLAGIEAYNTMVTELEEEVSEFTNVEAIYGIAADEKGAVNMYDVFKDINSTSGLYELKQGNLVDEYCVEMTVAEAMTAIVNGEVDFIIDPSYFTKDEVVEEEVIETPVVEEEADFAPGTLPLTSYSGDDSSIIFQGESNGTPAAVVVAYDVEVGRELGFINLAADGRVEYAVLQVGVYPEDLYGSNVEFTIQSGNVDHQTIGNAVEQLKGAMN